MAYNLFCRGEFNSISIDNTNYYQLDILKKDYSGDSINITLGANPIIHQWQDDDSQKSIKGSSLTINLINKGSEDISLSDFYSNEDDAFLVVLYNLTYGEDIIFKGFVVQDDCSEIMVDYAHQIQISATDNLGILKDYTFDQAAIKFGPYNTDFGLDIQTVTDGLINYIKVNETYSTNFLKIKPGNKIYITGGTYFDGIYTVLDVFPNGSFGFTIQVEESVGGNSPSTLCNLTYQIPYDITSYLSLKEILRLCILSTGIELDELRVISRLKPNDKDRWIDDTYINANSFLINSTEYYNCYKILEDIMIRFRASLFQAYGFWYIVRIGEYPICNDYTTMLQYVNRYDALNNFEFLVSGSEDIFFNIQQNNAETSVIKSLLRPYNYIKENFNYKINQNLLFNENLQQLGTLINSYTSSTNTIYEYEAPGFNYNPISNSSNLNFFIRITYDSNNNEIERKLVLVTSVSGSGVGVVGNGIYLSKGDVVKINYNTKSNVLFTSSLQYELSEPYIIDASLNKLYLQYNAGVANPPTNGSWVNSLFNFQERWENGDITNQWRNVSMQSNPAPFDGFFVFEFVNMSDGTSGSRETHFNNINISIAISSNTDTNIVGHYHKTLSNTNIKNNDEIDISLDDSKNSSITGTFFKLNDSSQFVKTNFWNYEGTCERIFNNVEFYYGYEHPIAGDNVIFIPGANLPSDFNVNDYPYGSQFTITNSTNGSDGIYTVNFIEAITFVPPYINYYVWTIESQPSVSALGTGDFQFNGVFSAKPLGQLTTFEQMYLRWRTRAKLDINILNIINNAGPISNQSFGPLHLIKYYGLQNIIFFLGSISLNYRTNSAQCTLYGLVDENEKRSDLEAVSSYEFNYLYENS